MKGAGCGIGCGIPSCCVIELIFIGINCPNRVVEDEDEDELVIYVDDEPLELLLFVLNVPGSVFKFEWN